MPVTPDRYSLRHAKEFQISELLPKDPNSSLSGEPDEDLLGYVKHWRNEDPGFAQAAWEELYSRHAAFLYTRLRQNAGRVVPPDELEFITKGVFADIYSRLADSYRSADGPPLSAEGQRKRIRAWLGRIGLNRLFDYMRETEDAPAIHLDDEGWEEVHERAEDISDVTSARVREIMERLLTERELDVLRWSYSEWYDAKSGKLHPKRDGVKALAARWNTTPENIRKIRDRALERLEKALREEMPTHARKEATP